jgi:integral membrane protein
MIKTLRLLALLEGISTLLLFGVAMPLKYIWHEETIMFPVGLAHGVLFIGYCLCVVLVSWKMKWEFKITFLSLLASLLPGGTFYADIKYFRIL